MTAGTPIRSLSEAPAFFAQHSKASDTQGLPARPSAIGARMIKAGFKPSLYHADRDVGENRPFADKKNGVHYFDHLAVLRNAKMPALLFEAGVIINRAEELRMADPVVRQKIAAAVSGAIEECMP